MEDITGLQETERDGADRIHLAQGKVCWQTRLRTLAKLQVL